MRADRLVAAVLLMQARGRITAAELAAELEISVATARRDLEALSAAGVPVYPQPGRGGGWALVGGARTDLTGLTSAEARALFLLAGPAAGAAPAVRSALRKLVRALPGTFRAEAQAAASAVVVDPAPWGSRSRPRPVAVETLEEAVVRRVTVRFEYAGRGARDADPWGLIDKDGVWYLIAGTSRGRRTFRADRMAAVTLTGTTFEPPPDFDLAAEWARTSGEVERKRGLLPATVLIAPRLVPILADHFGHRHCTVLGEEPDGRARVRVAAPMALSIAEKLAGWGAAAEVLDPPEVRAELARLGRELLARNS